MFVDTNKKIFLGTHSIATELNTQVSNEDLNTICTEALDNPNAFSEALNCTNKSNYTYFAAKTFYIVSQYLKNSVSFGIVCEVLSQHHSNQVKYYYSDSFDNIFQQLLGVRKRNIYSTIANKIGLKYQQVYYAFTNGDKDAKLYEVNPELLKKIEHEYNVRFYICMRYADRCFGDCAGIYMSQDGDFHFDDFTIVKTQRFINARTTDLDSYYNYVKEAQNQLVDDIDDTSDEELCSNNKVSSDIKSMIDSKLTKNVEEKSTKKPSCNRVEENAKRIRALNHAQLKMLSTFMKTAYDFDLAHAIAEYAYSNGYQITLEAFIAAIDGDK